MKFIQLTLYINADEAETIIAFIDELREVLAVNYSEEIRANQRASLNKNQSNII
ncbi:MAG: hypothetical protein HRT37_20355 [Alteromonadaceae bacterium]|nr:hypothetical protein [Alteromonadaceae bacterium]